MSKASKVATAANYAVVCTTGIHRLYVKIDFAAVEAAGTDIPSLMDVFAQAYPNHPVTDRVLFAHRYLKELKLA